MSDLKLLFQKRPSGVFAPADPEADAWAHTVAAGDEVFLKPSRPRNPKHHRLAFALFQFVLDATDRFANVEQLLLWLKLKTGHYQEHVTEAGELVYVPKSISFAAMSQDSFHAWHAKALEIIRRDLFPAMTDEDMSAALSFYEGDKW